MEVKFYKGNAYLIPSGSEFGYMNKLAADTFHNKLDIFHNCNEGDIWWSDPETHSKIFPPSHIIRMTIVKNAIKNGMYGCTSKMSDKEYQDYAQRLGKSSEK